MRILVPHVDFEYCADVLDIYYEGILRMSRSALTTASDLRSEFQGHRGTVHEAGIAARV